ncbi:MAG: hypothetical protein KJZ80_20040, partial [Hyphomicrobiaceae bacterium]|nr:hypothetical protein [Hyphomicrobiaceae bacterium]
SRYHLYTTATSGALAGSVSRYQRYSSPTRRRRAVRNCHSLVDRMSRAMAAVSPRDAGNAVAR